jgi:hypothetical protein
MMKISYRIIDADGRNLQSDSPAGITAAAGMDLFHSW